MANNLLKSTGENNLNSPILKKLLNEVKPVDFVAEAYPRIIFLRNKLAKVTPNTDQFNNLQKDISKFKVTAKQYLVTSVDVLRTIADKNKWYICVNNGFIYCYNGQYWETIDREEFQSFLGAAALMMNMDYFDAAHYKFKEDMYQQFISSAHLPVPIVDNSTVLINVNNGTLHIKNDGSVLLMQFNHRDFLKYKLDFDYDPSAKCPIFNSYLDKVLPEEDAQNILAEYLGYTFIRSNAGAKFEKALILYGSGANGKSVFFEVCSAIFGDTNISSYSLSDLTDTNGYHRAQIHNKLLNYSSEISTKMDTTLFKQLVSGEKVPARLPYQPPFEMSQYAKLVFNCNELPRDVEMNNAFYRRFLIVPFNVVIQEKEQDRELHHKIINSDLPGIFNWIIQGLQRLMIQKDFSHSSLVESALDEYRMESNSIELFLNENNYKKSVNHSSFADIFDSYKSYCIANGMSFVKAIRFKKYLLNKGFTISRRSDGNIVYIESIFVDDSFELIPVTNAADAETNKETF